tara:strand:+ start:129 stop:362 length:234 start_codon:yes stop_codon:yes gene_type:complete
LEEILSIFYLILAFGTADVNPGYQLIKIPITQTAKKITCKQAYAKSIDKSDASYGNFYKGKMIGAYWCKDKKGNWVR